MPKTKPPPQSKKQKHAIKSETPVTGGPMNVGQLISALQHLPANAKEKEVVGFTGESVGSVSTTDVDPVVHLNAAHPTDVTSHPYM